MQKRQRPNMPFFVWPNEEERKRQEQERLQKNEIPASTGAKSETYNWMNRMNAPSAVQSPVTFKDMSMRDALLAGRGPFADQSVRDYMLTFLPNALKTARTMDEATEAVHQSAFNNGTGVYSDNNVRFGTAFMRPDESQRETATGSFYRDRALLQEQRIKNAVDAGAIDFNTAMMLGRFDLLNPDQLSRAIAQAELGLADSQKKDAAWEEYLDNTDFTGEWQRAQEEQRMRSNLAMRIGQDFAKNKGHFDSALLKDIADFAGMPMTSVEEINAVNAYAHSIAQNPQAFIAETQAPAAVDEYKSRTSYYETYLDMLNAEKQMKEASAVAAADPEWETRSQYVDRYNGDYSSRFTYDTSPTFMQNMFGLRYANSQEDDLYNYINSTAFQNEYEKEAFATGTTYGDNNMGYNSVFGQAGYHLLTDDEKKEFNVRWSQETTGPEEAKAYLESLKPKLMKRRADVQKAAAEAFAEEAPGAAFALSGGARLADTYLVGARLMTAAMGEDGNSIWSDLNRFSSNVDARQLEMATEAMPWEIPFTNLTTGEALLGTLQTGRDNTLRYLASFFFGDSLTAASTLNRILGASTAVNSYLAQADSSDPTGNVVKALAAGAIEYATEKMGFDALFGDRNELAKHIAAYFAEGGEEIASSALNTFVDELYAYLTGSQSNLKKAYKQNLLYYRNEQDAARTTTADWLKSLGGDFLIGTLSGAGMVAASDVQNHNVNVQTGTRVLENDAADQLLALAETMPEGSEIRKVAENIRKRMKPVTKMEAKQAEAAPEAEQKAPVQQEQAEQAVSKAETTTETTEAPTETAQNAPQEAVEEQTADNTQEAAQAPETKETPKKNGKRISPAKLGQLYRTLYNDLDAQGKQAVAGVMESSVKGRLAELGEDQASIDEVAAPLAKLLADDTLTNKEKQIITKSKNGLRVFNEIRFAEDDTYSSNWVAEAGRKSGEAMEGNLEARVELERMLAPKVLRPAVEAAQRTVAESGMAVANAKHGTDAKLGVQLTGEGGKTQDAEILQVTGVTKQGMQVKVKGSDGQTKTVDMADMKFANSDTATIAAYIQKAPHVFTAEEANKMMQTYMGGDVQEHISGFTTLYNAGYAGRAIPPSKLPQAQVIYDLGKQDAATDEANRLKGIGTGKRGTGKVTFAPGVQRAGLNKVQRDSEYLLRVFAKAHGMDFVLYESAADADGYYRAANGRYQNNTLYIDMNSGKNSATDTTEYAILRTAAHEITHYIEHNSAEGYARLKDYVKSEYARKGKSWDNLVEAKLNTRTMNSRLTRAGAEAEVMADAMEMMLQDSKAIERLQKRDQSLYEKIKRFIVDYFRKVREAFANVGAVHKEAKWLMEEGADGVMHYAEKMVQLWDDALVEAAENVQGKTETSDSALATAETVQLSVRDDEYISAVNAGDMQKAQQLVNEAAEIALHDSKVREKNGNLLKVFHGTKAEFTVFDTSKQGGVNGTNEGYGIYLSDSQDVTGAYGDRQISAFANIKKPATSWKKTVTLPKLSKLIKATCEAEAKRMVADGDYDSVKEAVKDTWVSNYTDTYSTPSMESAYRMVASDILRMNDNDMAIVQEVMAGMAIRDYASAEAFYKEFLTPVTGIDGFWTKWTNHSTGEYNNIILAMESSQIKSADPVTYDDDGNIIPLDERFDTDDPDIRYSLREVMPVEPRSGYGRKEHKLTKRQYESFGWVRANNVLNKQAYSALMEKYSKVYEELEYAPESHDGYKIIETGDEFGVNKYIALVKGNLLHPEIDRIYEIGFDTENSIDYIRRLLEDDIEESRVLEDRTFHRFAGKGVLFVRNRQDYPTYRSYAQKYSGRNAGKNGKDPVWTYAKWLELNGYADDRGEDVQESRREVTPHTLAYSYMETMQPTTSMNESERWLLDKYQHTVKELQEKQEAYNEQRNLAVNGTNAEERTKAKARANLLDKQMGHLRETLRKAERSEGFATLMNTAQKVAERFMTDENNLLAADASDRLDNELADVQAQLKAITKQLANAEAGQRTAFAKGLFNAKALNEAGQTIRKAFNTRMSGKEISNRLALAYAELYAENNPERFATAMRALAQDVLESSKSRYRSPVLADLKDNIGSIGLSEAQKQELAKNGITISDFKRVVNPVVQVIDGGADLGTIVSSAEYYGTGIISQLSSADSEGDMIMTLYKTIQDERAKEAEAAMEGMTHEESIGYTMAEIMNTANFPLAENGANLDSVRNALTEGIEGNRAIATQVDKALATAKRASASAGNLWRKAAEINSAGKQAVEYYRAIDEQRRLLEQEELVLQLKSEAAQELKKQRQDFRDRMDRDRRVRDMNMKAAQHRKHLAAQVKKLDGLIRHETDYKHVPEELKPLVETFVGAFTEKGAGIVFNKQQADKLSRVYRKLLQTDGSMNQLGYLYDEDVMKRLDELNDLLEEEMAVRSGKGMTMEERAVNRLATMEDLAEIADSVYGMVKNANELFYSGKKAQFAAIGTEAMQAMEQRQDYRRLKGKAGENVEAADNFMRAGNMTPVYFFDRLKNKVFKTLYGDMLAAQDEYAFRVEEAKQFWQATKEKYHYDSWADDAALTMKTEKGKQLTLDKEDAMSVYATWKREHADELLPSYHLEDGGIVLEGNQMQDGDKKYLVAVRTTPTTLTQNDMAKIHAYLTEEQRAYADAVVEYMSTTMADYGNETSMELYGIKKYKESYYFPMKTAGDQLYQKSTVGGGQVTDDNRVKHVSFTKARVRGAATPVVIGKFSEVAAMHMEQMILYSTMTVPIESMNRVLNYKHQFEDGSKTTVRALMEQKYGPVMKKYMETFLNDMNGGIRRDNREAGLNKLVSLFKRGSVLASASVVVQQPTAIARATAMISPKHLMATTVPHKGDYDELKKHSGVAILKSMGKFDVDMGAATAEWMLEADEGSYSMWQKVRQATNIKDFETFKKRWNAIFTWAPGKADEMTWAWLWRAVKAEQAEAHPEMNVGSDAFLDMCGERFNDIVNHTQVYDSTLVRSQNMRSKSGLMQSATSFMSEPTLTANMLYDAVTNRERGKQYAVRAVTAALVSQILTALAQALVSAGRDEDEKKTWVEKYAGKAAGNLASNLNPMSMLPLLRDIQSLIDGYDVTRADMSIFTEIFKAFGKLDDENISPYRKAEDLGGSLAKLLGIPAKNIMRDLRSFTTTFFGNADRPTSGYAVGEAVKGGLIPGYDTKPEAYYERAYQAMNKGDQATVDTIREYMTTVGGKKDEEVDSGIAKRLRARVEDGKITKDDAIKWLVKHKLEKSEKKAFDEVDEWTDTKAYKDIVDDYSYKKYGEIEMALKKGDTKTVKTLMDEMLKYGNKEDDVISAIKTSIGNLYKNGELTKAEATKLYKHYDPKADDEDIFWLHDKWDLTKKNADVDGYNWTKTGAFLDSIPNGGSKMVKEARKLLDNGVKKGSISSAIKNRYKDQFVELYKKGQAANLLARLLSAYEAIGYSRGAMQSKIMSWLTEDEEE